MEEELKSRFSNLPDNELLKLYAEHRNEYTDEAIEIMLAEISSRKITLPSMETSAESANQKYAKEDFVPLKHLFSQLDILLVQLMLRDSLIPFYVQMPTAPSSVLPVDGNIMQSFVVHIHKDKTEQAEALINEHFENNGESYIKKSLEGKLRLRSIGFHEMQISELEAMEEVDAELGEEERELVVKYIDRAISEADQIEKKLERGIFYFDNLEDVRNNLSSKETSLTRGDLLAILEVLQIFCDEDNFPQSLENAADAILDFMSQ